MRKKNTLELVHTDTDVCHVDAKSHAGAQYFVTFIDDYSRKLWVSPTSKNSKQGRRENPDRSCLGRQWRRIPMVVRGILPVTRHPTGVHSAEDLGAKRYGRKNEPNHDGESLMHAGTQKVTKAY